MFTKQKQYILMMGRKGKEISLEQKSSILALLNSGTSKADISRLLSLNPSIVYKFCKRFSVRQCKENKPRSGRPSVVSGRGNTLLSRIVKSNRRKSLDDITSIFNERCLRAVSRRPIQRKLHELGYSRKRVAKTLGVREYNKKRRCGWCRERLLWTVNTRHVSCLFEQI